MEIGEMFAVVERGAMAFGNSLQQGSGKWVVNGMRNGRGHGQQRPQKRTTIFKKCKQQLLQKGLKLLVQLCLRYTMVHGVQRKASGSGEKCGMRQLPRFKKASRPATTVVPIAILLVQ
jgi:hypothetical protein